MSQTARDRRAGGQYVKARDDDEIGVLLNR